MIDSSPVSLSSLERAAPAREISNTSRFVRRATLFLCIGLLLYLALYVFAEQLVYRETVRNRFFVIHTAPLPRYDMVVLGASHGAVFDYADMNAQLESQTRLHILNLSNVGAGITPNRLALDYMLATHSIGSVLYVLDSFIFYSPQWNEQRLSDSHLYDRAPFDPRLAALLARTPGAALELPDYVLGFSKINNPDRFKPDISDDEALRFNSTFPPIPQIDAQRIRYLYSDGLDQVTFNRYMTAFEQLLIDLEAQGVHVTIIKPPLPDRLYRQLPAETDFDDRLQAVLTRHGLILHDFSHQCNDERYFFNPDHLNRAGVLNFYSACLSPVLVSGAR